MFDHLSEDELYDVVLPIIRQDAKRFLETPCAISEAFSRRRLTEDEVKELQEKGTPCLFDLG